METKKLNLSLISMILGIIGMVTGCMCIGIPIAIAGIVFGVISIKEGCSEEDKRKSIIGIISGAAGILFLILILAIPSNDDSSQNVIDTEIATESDYVTETLEDVTEKQTEATEEIIEIATELEEIGETEELEEKEEIEETEETEETEKPEASSGNQNEVSAETLQSDEHIHNSAINNSTINNSASEENSTVSSSSGIVTEEVSNNQAVAEQVVEETAPVATGDESIIVHITDTGEKYHSANCQYLRQSDHEISLADAKARNYTPCSRCNPPR